MSYKRVGMMMQGSAIVVEADVQLLALPFGI